MGNGMDVSTAELIILAVIIILILTYSFVFLADGFVFVKLFADSRIAAPDKNSVVARIKEYKARNKTYPLELERTGLRRQYGTVYLSYMSDGGRFEVCYRYFPYLGTMVDCYDSDVGSWRLR